MTAAPANFNSFLPLSQQQALPSQRHYPAHGYLRQSRVQLVFPKQLLIIAQGKGSQKTAETSLPYFPALEKTAELGPQMLSKVSQNMELASLKKSQGMNILGELRMLSAQSLLPLCAVPLAKEQQHPRLTVGLRLSVLASLPAFSPWYFNLTQEVQSCFFQAFFSANVGIPPFWNRKSLRLITHLGAEDQSGI